MKVNELKKRLDEIGVSEDVYSIMFGGLPNERLCIVKEEMWKVYYSERGRRSGEKFFETEEEACEYFFELLKRCDSNSAKFYQKR